MFSKASLHYSLPVIWLFISLLALRHASGDHDDSEEHEGFAPVLPHGTFVDEICEEPSPPTNGELICGKHKKKANKYVCKAQCHPGFEFPNGKQKGRHVCDLSSGKWSPAYEFPDCQAICNPPCENGGDCVEGNHCVCTAHFRGDRCQYPLDLCEPSKSFHVSADWSCNHTSPETFCVLNCPEGTRYETQPAEIYRCSLDGSWTPSFAPKCVPINIIEPPVVPGLFSVRTGRVPKSSLPSSAVCAVWGNSHYRTFDGGIYSFQGSCSYVLSKDCEQNTFAIHIQNAQSCDSVSSCSTSLDIYIGAELYSLSNGAEGLIVQNNEQIHVVPTVVNGILFQMLSDYVTVSSSLGFRLKWNRKNTVLLKATNQLKNKTCGLCGRYDGSVLNDFETSDGSITDSIEGFVNSWIMEDLGGKCEHKAVVKDSCSENKERVAEAEKLCRAIYDDKFSSCHELVDPTAYYEVCKMDHCSCRLSDGSCYCSSLAEYFRECVRFGGKIDGGWRSDDLCPLSCPDGMIYRDCGTSCPKTCKDTVYDCEDDHCVDGCHCREGTVLHNGRCVERSSCPCLHNGQEHQPGERVLQECNACECNAGRWECTKEKCDARCSSAGDPHYTTFDGLSYEFLGSCPYYLVYHANFSIVQEVGPCPELSNSEPATESMFCTQALTVAYGEENSLLLKPGRKLTYNEKDVSPPLSEGGFLVSMATDTFLKVGLDNGVSMLWDGANRIYIDAPSSLYGQTAGLCGTFNKNQNDDFLTPDNDIEKDVTSFAAKWQASDSCHKRERRSHRSPCASQPQKMSEAKVLCSAILNGAFKACHGEVDPEAFYKGCISDLCVCGQNLKQCLCPLLADYSLSCSKKGVILNWIDEFPACKPECTGGQVYQECANPCKSSCSALSSPEICIALCVQGCACVEGKTLNNEGFCVAADQCPCVYENKEYLPSSVTVQSSNVCTCQAAKWECRPGTLPELISLNPDMMIDDGSNPKNCLSEENEEFTQCVEKCPLTCQNAHLPPKCKTEECKPGCKCKDGFIYDTEAKKCVEISQCGCVHARLRYKDGETRQQDCNFCTCISGTWNCTEKVCPGTCSAWGESHFKTFDGKIFDFQGECEYILSKGKMKGASFSLSVQNVPCGTNGITCSKSFTLDLGPTVTNRGDLDEISGEEKLTLTKGDPLPRPMLGSRFMVMESGLYVMVYTDIGISLQWDRGTRLYVILDPKWRDRVKGLCGNFNDDQADDFLTPSGGIPEGRASIFADSWKVHEFCPQPQTIEDICEIHTHRKTWAEQKCSILKSDVFSRCHSEVALEPFYERCVFDSCACDMGGDCDCLCTAIATYAHECGLHGVAIKWRSQELCPIQCEECAEYDSCMPSCPKKTCENEFLYGRILEACSEEFCVEGCNPKPCPEGQVYNNDRDYKCIPQVDCVTPCLELNGRIYNEGERITDVAVVDACQSCHCVKGSISCTGLPCADIEPPRPCIQTGWTPWMNTPSFVGGDLEELSDTRLKATYENYCGITNMTNIECRVAESKIPHTERGQSIECQLPQGLSCRDDQQKGSICEDYEIRVFCDCGPVIEEVLPTTPPIAKLPPLCEHTGWTAWMSSRLPNEEGESETLDTLRINHYFCSEDMIENIECRTTMGWKLVTNEDENIICNKKLGLVCKGPECADYEVRLYCNCGEQKITSAIPRCVTGWTEFFNTDHPDRSETGDDESLEKIREQHEFCIGGTIEDIECKGIVDGNLVDYTSLDTFGLKCSKNVGFICNKWVRTDKCPDFMVRFYCACEPVAVTTQEITMAPTTTPTPIPVTPVPVECGWTPWLNIDTPESGDGDTEDLALLQMVYKTCGGKDLVDIECRMSRTLHTYSESLQQNLQCDTKYGFRCRNDDQIGNCYDYEVRLLCMYDWCYPPTTAPIPTTTEVITTPNPCPDGQVYDECAYRCDQLCSSFAYQLRSQCASNDGCVASCRPIDGCHSPNMWRDYYTCVPKEKCICIMIEGNNETIVTPQDVIENGCEKCQCIHDDLKCFPIPGCGVTQEPAQPRIIIPEDILLDDCSTKWINIDKPATGGGDLETLREIRQIYDFCYDPIKIECRTAEGKKKPSEIGQQVTCDLESGLICWNKENKPDECFDYEVRFFCPCGTQAPTTTTPIPTLEPGPCEYGWTEWFNTHIPDGRGEYETVQTSRRSHYFCANDMISAIECRPVGAFTENLQHSVICDLEIGLKCNPEYFGNDESCWDYEVRFFCDCPTIAPLPETLPPSTTPKLPVQLACSYWSEWINENHPKGSGTIKTGVKGGGGYRGDSEKVMLLKLQREYNFCLEGHLSEIECREASTDLDYTETGDKKLTCSLTSGFRCKGKDQPKRLCKDYKIRYFCDCETTPTPVVIKPVTPPIYVEPCSSYYNIVDGPFPLPDSSLKASSSQDASSGPQSARLSTALNEKSAGAWIAGTTDEHQFIEVDLGYVQPVYGVVTKGRNGYQEWVKSYKVLYSRNGMAYSYVRDPEMQNGEKIFTGNYDSNTEVKHIFETPFEARYVRIQPLKFHKEIAMRIDLMGCAEDLPATTTTVATTTAAISPPCIDEMGMYNGKIRDYQIKTSSDRNLNSDGRYVRLNTPQTEEHSGGWVAGDSDEYQFVQIDFLELRNLTGIKTQGRDMVPQWVTAFIVSYSKDGDTWNRLSDEYGVKIFPGNYDSNTAVISYFPQPIRTRFLRIQPISWENWIAMRLEILGCYEAMEEVKAIIPEMTTPVFIEDKCIEPMGFENYQLPDALISVSSSRGPNSGASRIRLNTHQDDEATGGWIAATFDHQPVILIDFTGERNLTGIVTQGLEDEDRWVVTYKVLYSLDNVTYYDARDMDTNDFTFSGNKDRNTEVHRWFKSMIQARFLKIIILDYHTSPAMRLEIYGCFEPYVYIPPNLSITTTEMCVEYSSWISLSDPAESFGDEERIYDIISSAGTCRNPFDIECRTMITHKDYTQTGQVVTCDLDRGLFCENKYQPSYHCYNYEVRIKCWTCGVSTTPQPLELCPETPENARESCPLSCPYDYACDGSGCVPHIDCPCFREGKRFEPSNIMITKDCQRCECILGGFSHCEPLQCPSCLPGQKSEIDENCQCQCVGCAEGTVLCPTNGECVREEQWCDGVVDCPDDETSCPTTPRLTTTTTIAPTTTELPLICSTDYPPDTDTCEMIANMFDTFDGLTYQYDICDHVLMKEAASGIYMVTVHKVCNTGTSNSCLRYIVIEVDNVKIKIGPGVNEVTVQDSKVPVANLWLVSQRFQDFELKKVGNSIVFRSKKYYFDVIWDSLEDVRITVSKCLVDQVVGLCGKYNRQLTDDRTMPDGSLAKGNEEFGDSWSIGSLAKCLPPTCPPDVMQFAIDICKEFKEEPFNSSCSDYVKIESRIEACIVFVCECLQRNRGAKMPPTSDVFYDFFNQGSCKCQAYESFVGACEIARHSPVTEWRIKHDCTPECPPGMEWQDCGPGCELTCDNYHEREKICNTDCIPGCYCPSGLIRHHNRCVKPKMCQDCVCRGHGDPNYITFDGKYYAFQGNCTYILAQHQTSSDEKMNFRILATNMECPEEPHTSCTAGLKVLWNGHIIEKFKNKPVYLDQVPLNPEDSPLDSNGISITFVPGKSTLIHIKEINLAVRYFDQMYGFNIELPAFFYYNKTEGLCGVCNFIQSDDLYHKDGYVTDNIEDFAYSWLEERETRKNCELPRVEVPEPPPGICNFTVSPCEVFLDPSLYSRSCQNDVSYSQKPEASMCRSKFQYAQQCCERGVSLVEWLKLSGCKSTCPEGMSFDCTSACQKTCDNYKDYKEDDCDLMPLYTCVCPEGQVMKLGKCIDIIRCETCDAEGHIVGEQWNKGPCESCECMSDLSTKCTITECPEPPLCDVKETLQKMKRQEDACCDAYQCMPLAEEKCPEPELQDCPPGQANVKDYKDGCAIYRCECIPDMCPPLMKPLLEEGENVTLETVGCCSEFKIVCNIESCSPPPLCGPGFKLSSYPGRCCEMYTCVRRKNICVYQHKYDIVDGSQVDLPVEGMYEAEYEPGSSWQDGLCRKCTCVEIEGQYAFSCKQEICPDPQEFPDADKYIFEKITTPGACCPKYQRTACLVGDVTYQISQEWPSPDGDKCKSYRCIEDQKGEAIRLEKTVICNKECPEYAVYEEALPESEKCCGQCRPIACEENGILYEDGATWVSNAKPCFTGECSVNANGTHITYRGESCPVMPENCPMENVRTDPKGCCTYCKMPTETCSAVSVPTYETRELFTFVDRDKGFCRNTLTLENLTKCSGQCEFNSLYSDLGGNFQNVCNCCVPRESTHRPITLVCEDGTKVEKIYNQPITCQCSSCSGSPRSLEAMDQIEPY